MECSGIDVIIAGSGNTIGLHVPEPITKQISSADLTIINEESEFQSDRYFLHLIIWRTTACIKKPQCSTRVTLLGGGEDTLTINRAPLCHIVGIIGVDTVNL